MRFIRSISLAAMAAGTLVGAEGNMIGNQSHNEGMVAVPKPGTVVIDGDFADWDRSGEIWVFADSSIRTRYSTKVAAMYDAEHLYLGIEWRDPTPMHSEIDPQFDPGSGWKSDSMQVRVMAGDTITWLTTWYFTTKQMPVLHVSRWHNPNNNKDGQDITILTGGPESSELGQGAAMAYRTSDDGAGFYQEIRIPWKLISTQETWQAGDVIRSGFEFLWGDPTGKAFPIHRYADNMQPDQTSREFFWTAKHAWGDIALSPTGQVEKRRYVNETNKPQGTIELATTVPANAARFTIAIDDADGKRVRNLVGGADPIDFETGTADGTRTLAVAWDGLNDKGELVEPGAYTIRGLSHEGLGLQYQQCFYNPGTPPWPVASGKGSWASDHATLKHVERSGSMMILACMLAEGGSGIIGIDAKGLKAWGEKRGANYLAADDTYVYALTRGHGGDGTHAGTKAQREQLYKLIRLKAKDGSYHPFVKDGAERPFLLPLGDVFGEQDPGGEIVDMAAGGGGLLIGLADHVLLIDPKTADLTQVTAVPGLKRLVVDGADHAIALCADGIKRIALADGSAEVIAIDGLQQPIDLALDNEGNIVVADGAPVNQVKAFDRSGKVVYTCGKAGGRPLRGDWDPSGMRSVAAVDVDVEGKVWVCEDSEYPRRVSVWEREGGLARDYIGNTGYAGTGCYLHDQDQTLGYVGPIEIKLDPESRSWAVNKILWVPDPAKGEGFEVPTRSHSNPHRFRSDASGTMREYLHHIGYRDYEGQVLYMEYPNGEWKPVAAITTAGQVADVNDPQSVVAGLEDRQTVLWNDDDADGIVDKSELVVHDGLFTGSGWGTRLDSATMNIFATGRIGKSSRDFAVYKPIGFSKDGAPRYGVESMRPLGIGEGGDLVPVDGTDEVILLGWKGYPDAARIAGIDVNTGKALWEYPNPYPGVHGSHRATMAKPGLVIGPLKILGQLDMGAAIGGIFALRGNLGQDFYLTTDGLMVGTIFQDCRLPAPSLPSKEEQLVGVPMEGYSNGGEPFNGWLGRHDDGVIRLTTGLPRQAAMVHTVSGLDSIHRLPDASLQVTQAMLDKANTDNIARAAAAQAEAVYTITKVDGMPEWRNIKQLTIERPGLRDKAVVKMAYDATNLYVNFTVDDTSPWLNEGKDRIRLFKTGDAVDIQFGPAGERKARDPQVGDARVLIAPMKDGRKQEPIAMLMRPVDPEAAEQFAYTYVSPVAPKAFDRVSQVEGATISAKASGGNRYFVTATLPLNEIGLEAKSGTEIAGDVGIILSDTAGMINTARLYWSNMETNLVNDEPQEAWLSPQKWGVFKFE